MRTRKAKVDQRLTRVQFRRDAKPEPVRIAGRTVGEMKPRESAKTKSLGWSLNCKMHMEVGGELVYCQVNASVTVIGSKDAPEGEQEPSSVA